MKHPQAGTDEIFVSNISLGAFRTLSYSTKRLGTRTFDGNGQEIFIEDWFPMFLRGHEVSESGILSLCKRIQRIEGLTKH